MKTIKTLLLASIFIIFHLSGFSQEKLISGSITLNSGEKKEGFILYEKTDKTPTSVKFQVSKTGQIEEYNPLSVSRFEAGRDIFISEDTETELSPSADTYLEADKDFRLEKRQLFLQVLVSGKGNLLYHKNELGKVNFYTRQGEEIILLPYKRYRNQVNKIQEIRDFSKILAEQLSDCDKLDFEKLNYDRRALIKLFTKYNECIGLESTYVNRDDEKLFLKLIGGVSQANVNFNSDRSAFESLTEATTSTSYQAAVGLSFEFYYLGAYRNLSTKTELLYTSYLIDTSYDRERGPQDYKEFRGQIGASYLKLNLLQNYRFGQEKTSVFVNGGGNFSFALSRKNKLDIYSNFLGMESNTTDELIAGIRNIEFGLIGGVGVRFNKLSCELRYERSSGLSNLINLKSPINRFYFLVKYRLTRL